MSEHFHQSTAPFNTEAGYTFSKLEFAYHTWGTLNASRDNVILICHALTGNSDAKDWFYGLFHENSVIDLDKHFVLCINHLGSCYGSTGPTSINPDTQKKYRADFPHITIRDLVRFQQRLLDHLNIEGIQLVVGGSMGGMAALEISLLDDRVHAAVLMAMGAEHQPWAIGISEAQRLAIQADKNWDNGFYEDDAPPVNGLKAARAMAMITYRAPENYQSKFGRSINDEKDIYEVESYLRYQGAKLATRFDANAYIVLSKAMDSHDISRERENTPLRNVPTLVLGFDSDILYPPNEQQLLAGILPNAQYQEVSSPYGHDAFLIEFEQINTHISNFLNLLESNHE